MSFLFSRRAVLGICATLGILPFALSPALQAAEVYKIGVEEGPHAEIMEKVSEILKKDGIELKVIPFSDYARPNPAVTDGDLDGNAFQHLPFFEQQLQDHHYDLASVGNTIVFPMGFYSKKFKSLQEIPDESKIAIQNDPSNGGRALLLLQSQGIIKLRDGSGVSPSPLDIVENPKKLKFIEVDADQTPNALADVAAAAINTAFALGAGLDLNKDAIAQEGLDSPYVNIFVVRKADAEKPWVKKLMSVYHSQEIRNFITEKYKGVVVPGF